MSNPTLVQKAQSLAELMRLSAEIGAAPQVTDTEVLLVGPGDEAPRRIGGSITEAVTKLRAMIGAASVAQLDGVSS